MCTGEASQRWWHLACGVGFYPLKPCFLTPIYLLIGIICRVLQSLASRFHWGKQGRTTPFTTDILTFLPICVLPSSLPNSVALHFSPFVFLPCQASLLVYFYVMNGQFISQRIIFGSSFGDAPFFHRKKMQLAIP